MGPLGVLQGMFISAGFGVLDFLYNIHEYSSIPPVFLGAILSLFLAIGGIAGIVLFTVLCTPKLKDA